MSRYARKVDENQPEIVKALRRLGVKVEPRLARLGGGPPDLLCGYKKRLCLLEVKDGSKPPSQRALTPDEEEWHKEWAGFPVYVVESVEEAVLVVTGKRAEPHGAKP